MKIMAKLKLNKTLNKNNTKTYNHKLNIRNSKIQTQNAGSQNFIIT